MKISVLIPSWRRADALARCLDGLEEQTRKADEVILAIRSRAEDPESWEVLERRTDGALPIEIASPAKPGIGAAINAALAVADGDLLAFTDDDAVPDPDWLERVEAHFEADEGLGGLGGRGRMVMEPDTAPTPIVGTVVWFGRAIPLHHLGSGAPREVDFLQGVNMSYRATALGTIRQDDALRGEGAQEYNDWDMSMAVKASGWRLIYDPAVAVDHYAEPRKSGSRDQLMNFKQRMEASHNETYVLTKNLSPARAAVAISYSLVVGTRLAPGPVLAVERMFRGDEPTGLILKRATASMVGRVWGLLTYVRRRRNPA